jgi:CheY-like chemotaxis protein
VNTILGLTELLRESRLSPTQQQHVSIARASADHLLAGSADIIDLARAELGSLRLRSVRFDLHEALRQAVEILSVFATHKGVTVRIHISDRVPVTVTGDPERLGQMLITVVRAGIQRITEGEIVVTVDHDPVDTSGNMIKVTVSDKGPPFPPDVRGYIFDSSTDLDTVTPHTSGLGLTLSRHLAELMGGAMWVENAPGSGSAIHFHVNLALAQPVGYVQGRPPAGSDAERPLKILVAEDTVDNLLLIRAFLKDESWEIDSADNGRIAVEKASATRYDLILMDIDMPEMDGHTATRKIRVLECANETPAVPIVALTAHHEAEAAFQSAEAGCTAHVTKPIRKAVLLETVRRYAAGHEETPVWSQDWGDLRVIPERPS